MDSNQSMVIFDNDRFVPIALALRNQLIGMITEIIDPGTDGLVPSSRWTFAFWSGSSNDFQACVNYLDSNFPGFVPEEIFQVYHHGLQLLELARKIYLDMSPIDMGDLFTMDEFAEAVEEHSFIDYDGFGYFSDGKNESNHLQVVPSEFARLRKLWPGFTHVIWFNK